ncbi:SagB/ThcOx family dehydrogenase [Candidatus Omnitrophota bacterium]
MQVLKARHSSREYSGKNLSKQILSNLLWAAWGVNRPGSGKRTAPSMGNRQTIDIYVANADGLYLFNAKENRLTGIIGKDIRALIGRQSFVKEAPVNLIFVADYSRMGNMSEEQKRFLSGADTGYISQNAYLYCASENLATVVYHSINNSILEKEMMLRPDQKITLAQSVGYPKPFQNIEQSIPVNIHKRTIGGIDMTQTPEALVENLGEDRVKKGTEILEGDPTPVHVIDFNGHKVYKHWNGLSFEDTTFVTEKGLRIGDKISKFDRLYGKGKIMWSEAGHGLQYHTGGVNFWIFFAQKNVSSEGNHAVLKDRSCKATKMWISVP